MSYTVLWTAAAERELAALWLGAANRRDVTDASKEIDSRLRLTPAEEGESRDLGQRILLVPPLGVTFEVLDDDRIVRVLDVWRFEKHV